MARSINFKGINFNFPAGIIKVDRKKIYGYSTIEVTDTNNSKCSLATLSEDGSQILPSGSTGIAKFNSENNYIETANIKAIDLEGNPAIKVPSVFDEEVILSKCEDITDYFNLNVKNIYQLTLAEESKETILNYLKDNLLTFVFNYRADYEGDDAFLISASNEVFAVVGNKCEFEFIGLEKIIEEEEETDDTDDFDFGML